MDLDPDCVDALVAKAQVTSRSREELLAGLQKAVQAGERTLGPEYFKNNRGRFWGLLETRPYMRARAELAETLWFLGRRGEAIGHYEALLDLNPNDNQGIRDILLGCYFEVDDLEGVRKLLKQYQGDSSAIFRWSGVLERFLSGDFEEAAKERKEAQGANPYVEAYLTGRKWVPLHVPDYYSPGKESEAIHCVSSFGKAWLRHSKALEWLESERP